MSGLVEDEPVENRAREDGPGDQPAGGGVGVADCDDDTGRITALASLDGWGPRRLATLFAHHDPAEAVAVVSGDAAPHPMVAPLLDDDQLAGWRAKLREHPPAEWAERCHTSGVRAAAIGRPGYPAAFLHDPLPPGAIFWRGAPRALDFRRVAIVGTRNATRSGREMSAQLGFELTEAGVAVVSGLARGIDAAAHRGALRADDPHPIGVAGNGLDRAYPRANAQLWSEVASAGIVMSEWPPGARPEAYRFPQRNRLIAALAEVVVVVESRETGGSLITAVQAAERDVPVMAVPGSVRNRAASGTNHLLGDGAAPVTGGDDVLTALGLDTRRRSPGSFDPRPVPRGLEAEVLVRCRKDPATLDALVVELEQPIGTVAMALARLERSGWVRESNGWFEAVNAWFDLD